MNELLSTTEVAEMHGVTRQTVLHWINRGWLPAQQLGNGRRRHMMISRADAETVTRPNRGPRPQVDQQVQSSDI